MNLLNDPEQWSQSKGRRNRREHQALAGVDEIDDRATEKDSNSVFRAWPHD